MSITRDKRDKIAVLLSMLCILQCLFLPIVISLIPLLNIWWLNDEFLHPILLFVVIPLTLFTLIPGYKHHHNRLPLQLAVPALTLLVIGAFIPPNMIEKMLTISGALVLSFAHIRNLMFNRACACEYKDDKEHMHTHDHDHN